MQLEELTKTQIVLLTLFVSFVTSIATGIVTVTLMDQAPTDVTRTINRVVERTVEKVVPGETKIVERIKEISNPTESDLAIGAIAKTKEVLVYGKLVDGTPTRGFFVSSKGEAIMLAPGGIVVDNEISLTWVGNPNASNTPILARVRKVDSDLGVMLISVATSSRVTYPFVSLDQALIPSLGQRVISVGFTENLGVNVEFGNVVGVLDTEVKDGERRFLTSLSAGPSHVGAPVVDVSARVLGLESGAMEGSEGSVVIPLPRLSSLMGTVAGTSTSTPLTQI
ncbi:MAG TPA: serine protease [Candidatus Paceibacterota bacterium]